jgi:uroporphyrinogen III methyltransferase/synthase
VAEVASRPLAGRRIVITRSAAQSEAIARELALRGAIPMVVPLVSFAEPEDFAVLDAAIAEMEKFDWIVFTSAQAVRAVVKRSGELKNAMNWTGGGSRVAAVGSVSAEAAREAGFSVEYVAETHTGAALAAELGERLRGAKVLLPRSDRANPDLPPALKLCGAQVTEVVAYRTLRPTGIDQRKLQQIADGGADAILFFSPSAVQHFAELFGDKQLRVLQDKLAIAAVGPVTASALSDSGVTRMVVAGDTTARAVVQAVEGHFASSAKQAQAGAKRA